MYLKFINDVPLLLALCLLQALNLRLLSKHQRLKQISTGLLFGGISVIGMLAPITLAQGIILDFRTVVACMVALFGGYWACLIATVIASACRLFLGGAGAPIGVTIILSSALLGVAYRYGYDKGWLKRDNVQFLAFGFIVHAIAVLLLTVFPSDIVKEAVSRVALAFLLVFSFATMCFGALLNYIENSLSTEEALRTSEARHQRVIEGSDQGLSGNTICVRMPIPSARALNRFLDTMKVKCRQVLISGHGMYILPTCRCSLKK